MGKYFGTDGFRGEAGVSLTADRALSIGRYLGSKFKKIVIGRDTRQSGPMLEAALTAGVTASGGDVYLLGVVPTPAVSYLTSKGDFDCGIMISASHNPFYDNGIKIIKGDGTKPGESDTAELEACIDGISPEPAYAAGCGIGTVNTLTAEIDAYKNHLIRAAAVANAAATGTAGAREGGQPLKRDSISGIFKGRRIALDCANGSASAIAPEIYAALGAGVFLMGAAPDGCNINEHVGSTHIEALQHFVTEHSCDIGFAYDGDADRCLAVDEHGSIINGDQIMYACALFLRDAGRLKDNMLIVTVMSNLGLLRALKKEGIDYKTTKVGDRFVWECMAEGGYSLGGEQSGHIIFADHASTGDGILTSLMIMNALGKRSASELSENCPMFPQTLKNLRVKDKDAILNAPWTIKAVKEAEDTLGSTTGRILVRPSGTEPLIRVMVEAPQKSLCDKICAKVIAAMEKAVTA